MKGWMYILECSDGSYYTGSTNNLEIRLQQHQKGEGANHTKKHLPIKLIYFEEFQRIDEAFYREKQVQGWSRKKKEALINSEHKKLPELSMAYRDLNTVVSSASTTGNSTASTTGTLSTSIVEISLLPEFSPLSEALEGNTTIKGLL
ncbi:MAG: GIY-YIG nuclease family protein [Salinivirgaceae bacterium]